MNVVGLDLSLASTGVAVTEGTFTYTAPKHPGGLGDPLTDRCVRLWNQICEDMIGDDVDLVVIEDLVARSQAAATLGVLHGVVRAALWHRTAVELVPPATLKKYATGKGNANKDAVRDAARDRGGLPAGVTSDECDAWWLRQIGLVLSGDPAAVQVPKTHQAALDKLRGGDDA